MSEHQVECTIVLKRYYAAPVDAVYRAWTEVAALARWYVAAADHVVHFAEADVRVGGSYRVGFAPPGVTPYIEEGRYLELVANERITVQQQVSLHGEVLFTQHTVIECKASGSGTRLSVTGTGRDSWRTGEGWTPALESLARYLAGPAVASGLGAPELSELVVRRSILIAASPEIVWQRFASMEQMQTWWGAVSGTPVAGQSLGQWLVAYEPWIGGRVEMEVTMDDARVRYGGPIVRMLPARELSFENDWMPNQGWKAPTYITLRLSDLRGGCLVELFHHGFERVGDAVAETHAGYEQGWGMLQLNALKKVVEAG